jgi:hypothetical protein
MSLGDGGPAGGNMQDLVSKQQQGVVYLGQLVKIFQNLFPRVNGTFTLAAAATTAVQNTNIQAGSVIQLTPMNAAAATLQGSAKALYISAINSGTGFTVATGNATNAAGTEQFSYVAFTPV